MIFFEPSFSHRLININVREAMEDEMKAIQENNTWKLVPRETSMNVMGLSEYIR